MLQRGRKARGNPQLPGQSPALFGGLKMKMKQHYETEAYLSDAGYYVIKQAGWPDEEVTVLLSKEQARRIRDDLSAKLREDWEQET